MAYDNLLLDRVRAVLQSRREVAEKHMFGGVAFMVRGHMSCGILGTSLMVRLDPARADALLRPPNVRPMDFTGRPMRGFLFVDAPAISTAAMLRKWIDRAVLHAQAQPRKKLAKPRPARRKARAVSPRRD